MLIYELLWLLLLGPFLLLPGRFAPLSLHPYLVAGLFLFLPLRYAIYRHQVAKQQRLDPPSTHQRNERISLYRHNPLSLSLIALLIYLPTNLLASINLAKSWIALGYLLWGVALYLVLVDAQLGKQFSWVILSFLLLIGGGLTLLSPLIVVWKTNFTILHLFLSKYLGFFSINLGETIHANVLAGVLVLILPLFFVFSLKPSNLSSTSLWLLMTFMTTVTLVLLIFTQSRGGYIAAVVALGTVLFLRYRWLGYFFISGGAIGITLHFFMHKVENLQNYLLADNLLSVWRERIIIWQSTVSALQDFPFTGVGIGTYADIVPIRYPFPLNIEQYPHAHNLYLQIAIDLGIPGLIAYVALLLNLFVMLIVLLHSQTLSLRKQVLVIGAMGSLVGLLTHGLVDAVSWGTKLAFLPWLLYALITRLFLEDYAATQELR